MGESTTHPNLSAAASVCVRLAVAAGVASKFGRRGKFVPSPCSELSRKTLRELGPSRNNSVRGTVPMA